MPIYESQATRTNLNRRTQPRLGPEQLLRLAQALPDTERLLIERHYNDGIGVTDLARQYRSSTQTIRRRIDRLTQRLSSAEFRFTVLHQDQMPKAMRRTATLLFVHGRSLRETAQVTKQTLHRVRCDRATIQTLARLGNLEDRQAG